MSKLQLLNKDKCPEILQIKILNRLVKGGYYIGDNTSETVERVALKNPDCIIIERDLKVASKKYYPYDGSCVAKFFAKFTEQGIEKFKPYQTNPAKDN